MHHQGIQAASTNICIITCLLKNSVNSSKFLLPLIQNVNLGLARRKVLEGVGIYIET